MMQDKGVRSCTDGRTESIHREGGGITIIKSSRYEVAMISFGRNIEQFCAMERGPALVREGSRKNYHYFFEYALLKPYVAIKGLSEGLVRTLLN
jgi:hypothetical protein